jgi:hypothetical protein
VRVACRRGEGTRQRAAAFDVRFAACVTPLSGAALLFCVAACVTPPSGAALLLLALESSVSRPHALNVWPHGFAQDYLNQTMEDRGVDLIDMDWSYVNSGDIFVIHRLDGLGT